MTLVENASTTLHPARRPRGEARPMTARDPWAIPRVGSPKPSPDGASLVVAVTTYDLEKNQGRSRIWLASMAPGGAEPRALTSAEVSSAEPAFSPDGKRLAFVRKVENAKAQLHVMPLDGG